MPSGAMQPHRPYLPAMCSWTSTSPLSVQTQLLLVFFKPTQIHSAPVKRYYIKSSILPVICKVYPQIIKQGNRCLHAKTLESFGSKHFKIYRTYQKLSFGVVPFVRYFDEVKKIQHEYYVILLIFCVDFMFSCM